MFSPPLAVLTGVDLPVSTDSPCPFQQSRFGCFIWFVRRRLRWVCLPNGYRFSGSYTTTTRRFGSVPVELVLTPGWSCKATWITWRS